MILDRFKIWADLSHLVSFQKCAPGEVRMALERNVAGNSDAITSQLGIRTHLPELPVNEGFVF